MAWHPHVTPKAAAEAAAARSGALALFELANATVADSERMDRLVSELGYRTSASQMRQRLEAILRDGDYDTLVAWGDGEIVGFIGTRIGRLYEGDEQYGQIMALAVAGDDVGGTKRRISPILQVRASDRRRRDVRRLRPPRATEEMNGGAELTRETPRRGCTRAPWSEIST